MSTDIRFGVIEFYGDASKDQLLAIDLVPGSWISKFEDGYRCKYPSKKDFEYVEKWTQNEKSPEKHWKSYPVKLIRSAADFAQGRRRLQRAYKTRDCASSDCGSQLNYDFPDMSESSVAEFLQTEIPMSVKSNKTKSSVKKDDVVANPRSKKQKKEQWRGHCDKANENSHSDESTVTMDKDVDAADKDPNTDVVVGTDKYPTQSELIDTLTQLFIGKFRELEVSLNRSILSSKQSVLYNLEHKIEELKLAIVATNIPQVSNKERVTDLYEALKTPLPMKTLDTFIEFNETLKEEPEKKEGLIALFRFLCFEHPTVQKCIDHVLPKVFSKEVQGKYSGQGKKVKGVGKLNFSVTETFTCFEAAILAKFGQCDQTKALKSKIGIWLTHFGDREGGRKLRENDNQ